MNDWNCEHCQQPQTEADKKHDYQGHIVCGKCFVDLKKIFEKEDVDPATL